MRITRIDADSLWVVHKENSRSKSNNPPSGWLGGGAQRQYLGESILILFCNLINLVSWRQYSNWLFLNTLKTVFWFYFLPLWHSHQFFVQPQRQKYFGHSILMESVSNLGEGIWIIFATSETRFPPILFATFQTKVSWVQYSDGFFLRPRRQASPNSFCNLMRQYAAVQTMHTPYSHTANRKNIFYSSQIPNS